jgi:hypothetical protein
VTDDRRPGAVTVLVGLAWLAAALYVVEAVVSVLRMLGPAHEDVLLGGPTSALFWLVNAAMAALMAVIFGWIGRGLARRDDGARVLVNVVAAISLVFSLFNLAFGVGFVSLVVSAVALVLNNTRSTKNWFGVTGRHNLEESA